ncbi:hypothetical protein SPRG_03942 [Saprolegnia parasitica CBS 223.65]|uniref:Serine/threonine-protein phosphatase PGAM5, mitochondrial n=1 Tax=Saprolegnia parasitica (strain CBS 223.65) TaxID=695850 RepID=A0A067CXT2_SAPPC|nr:hypothetical protein SPRG_03942 [Saprolegnia parasitica CBS 223.65]KDO31326.1 hypothetical protein SPRG_03942 [Saprolegnia parasitica CBS 223.65]|eukprot:XP_012197925.1 hypothetical protein SPRG_03942 [Saprolegnia parasitica CBS 223.65]
MGRPKSDSFAKEGEALRSSFNQEKTLFDKLKAGVHKSRAGSFDEQRLSRMGSGDDLVVDLLDLKTFNHRLEAVAASRKAKRVAFAEELCTTHYVDDLQYPCPLSSMPYNIFRTRRVISYEEEEQLLTLSWDNALPYSSVDFGAAVLQMHSRNMDFLLVGPVKIHHVSCMGISWKSYWAGLASGIMCFAGLDDVDQIFQCPIHKCRVQVLSTTEMRMYEVAGLRDVDELFLKFANAATLHMWFWSIQMASASASFMDPDHFTKRLRRLMRSTPEASVSFVEQLGQSLGFGARKSDAQPDVQLPVTLRNPPPVHPLGPHTPSNSKPAAMRHRILFVRHGEYENHHFKTMDPEKCLTPLGEEQSRATAKYLSSLIDDAGLTYQDVRIVYANVTRSIQTMDFIAKEIDASAGIYETYNPYETSSRQQRVARHEFALLRESAPHGLSASQRYLSRSAKMALALQLLCAPDDMYPITIVVCSSSFIRYCTHQAAYNVGFVLSPGEMNHTIVMGYCSVTQIDVGNDHALYLRGINETTHLAGVRESVTAPPVA